MKIIPVILCGGSGSRLWPLSRNGFPKQFLSLPGNGSNKTLFQQAVERSRILVGVATNIGSDHQIIVSSEAHRFLVAEQLRELEFSGATLLLEPVARNTAAALTLAAFDAQEKAEANPGTSPIMVVMPADHIIHDAEKFTHTVKSCIKVVAEDASANSIALLGIHPASPETGYGYIRRNPASVLSDLYQIEEFCEKPDLALAQKYCNDGNYFWNAGIFILRADTWLSAISQFRPDILGATQLAWTARRADVIHDSSHIFNFVRPGAKEFDLIPSESIDYAVIEKCAGSNFNLKMAELNAGWSDLGSWDAVWKTAEKDPQGNITDGETIFLNTQNTLVYSGNRLVVAAGVSDLVIIDTPDALLVMNQSCSQDIKQVVSRLSSDGRNEVDLHRKVYRPWGWYDSIEEGPGFKVKRILVKPGASLSLQKHHHRAEHWVVVSGQAEVTNGEQVLMLDENQSTYIPQGQIHRLRNLGERDLEIIEIQSGEYLGEDDIVRLEDVYGRN